jgi:thiamine biosynthesis lipoprotein
VRTGFSVEALLVLATLIGSLASKTYACDSNCKTTKNWVREEGSIDAMGSIITIVAYGKEAGRVRAAISDALDEAARLDAMLSNYKPNSEWSEMNRRAAERPVPISKELFHLLATCIEYSRESEGTFDISVGPLMKVWGFYKQSGHPAERAQVLRALDFVGYGNIILDPRALTVRFARKGVELDPGGIGKGYAVDRMAEILRRNGICAALISAAGSSIYGLGAPPGENGWRIDIKDPKNLGRTAQSVTLRDQSLSTSGNYEKSFYFQGKLWSHIMDPRTGYPSQGMLSVSLVAPKTIDSEAWAKPYYILGRRWTARHKKKAFRVFMCEDKPDAKCSWVE